MRIEAIKCVHVHCLAWQAAYQAGEEEVNLSTMGRSYLLDFNAMQQINEDTGTARPVVRKASSFGITGQNSAAGDPGM